MALLNRGWFSGQRDGRSVLSALLLLAVIGCLIWTTQTLAQAPPSDGSAASQSVAAQGSGSIPTRNLLDAVRDGGPLMMAIAVCSFVLCVFVCERGIFTWYSEL